MRSEARAGTMHPAFEGQPWENDGLHGDRSKLVLLPRGSFSQVYPTLLVIPE